MARCPAVIAGDDPGELSLLHVAHADPADSGSAGGGCGGSDRPDEAASAGRVTWPPDGVQSPYSVAASVLDEAGPFTHR